MNNPKYKYSLFSFSLVVIYVIIYFLNRKILNYFFPNTGMGIVLAFAISIVLFLFLFIGFFFIMAREKFWISGLYFIIITLFIVGYDWKNYPSDVGQYPYKEIQKCFAVVNEYEAIEMNDIFEAGYERIAAIYKFRKQLPDFAFVVSKKTISVKFIMDGNSYDVLTDNYFLREYNDSIFIIGEIYVSIAKDDLSKLKRSISWKNNNGEIISLERRSMNPSTKFENLFYEYLNYRSR